MMSVLAPAQAVHRRFSFCGTEAFLPERAPSPASRLSTNRVARFQSMEQMNLLGDDDARLDNDLAAYVAEEPLIGDLDEDVDRFLEWLEEREIGSHEEDQRATSGWGVELHSVRRRLQHARFQRLLQRNDGGQNHHHASKDTLVHLNPVHLWVRLDQEGLDESDGAAMKLFFQVGRTVRSMVIPAMAEPLLRTLERGPLSLKSILRPLKGAGRELYESLLNDLAAAGVIAVG